MSKELITANKGTLCVFNDSTVGDMYTSFNPESIEAKKKLFNAINSTDNRLADYINKPINMVDVVVRKVELSNNFGDDKDKDTPPEGFVAEAEKREGFRVVIIDDDGVSYAATSAGIYNSICTLRNVFGDLHFDEGLQIIPKQVKTKNGNTLTIALAD